MTLPTCDYLIPLQLKTVDYILNIEADSRILDRESGKMRKNKIKL